jgi:hypothetical protein
MLKRVLVADDVADRCLEGSMLAGLTVAAALLRKQAARSITP